MGALARLVAVAAVIATIAGGLFDAVHGGTTLASAIAYAFWFAAAFCLLLMAVAGTKLAWRRLDLP